MDAIAPTTSPSADDHHHHVDGGSKYFTFVGIAMLLAVITGIEIVLVYLPLPKWLVTGALVILSTVKFMFVIFYFMHLKWDKMFCTILFFIGLVLAGGTVTALLAIFGAEDSKPLPMSDASPLSAEIAGLA